MLGEIPIEPITGIWPLRDLPERIAAGAVTLRRSRMWAFPYAGVVAQYRGEAPTCSLHLRVLEDGTYLADHLDVANPEQGRVVEHFLKDTPRPARS